MHRMYLAHWGLAQPPFAIAASRRLVEQHPVCAEALARLDFLVENRSQFGLLVGPAGSGKSLVLAEFARRQRAAGTAIASLTVAGVSAREVLLELATAWGAAPHESDDVSRLWRLATDRLAELRLEQVPAALAVDDLDGATSEVLGLVQRLVGVADVELTIVAAARDEGIARLGKRLLDKAELRMELSLWTFDETRDYLKASLSAAGRQQPAFAEPAVQRLFELSGGAPRRLGQLAQLALVAGAGQKLNEIDEQTVQAVHEELSAAR
jgi:general secretion pathway protein A